jgi:hypothetical protein
MNWEVYGRKRSWPNLRHYHGICLPGLSKSTKILSQVSRSPGRDATIKIVQYISVYIYVYKYACKDVWVNRIRSMYRRACE